jgi:protein-disulfide isomerase
MKRFQDAIDLSRGKGAIDSDMAEGNSIGPFGTPAFFVNGHYLSGAKPFEEFAKVINAELSKLNLPIPGGATKSSAH